MTRIYLFFLARQLCIALIPCTSLFFFFLCIDAESYLLTHCQALEIKTTSKPYKMVVITKATIASFGGKLLRLSHIATSTKCEMDFNLYLPPQAFEEPQKKIPVLIYLSGLTCTAENCSEKGFFQHGASKKGIAVLYPDTSPSMILLSLARCHFSMHFRMFGLPLAIKPQKSTLPSYGHK